MRNKYYLNFENLHSEIRDVQHYMFDWYINEFLKSIKVYPNVWSQSRVGRDDFWGVDLMLSHHQPLDLYIWLKMDLNHPKIGTLWMDCAYTSGSTEKNDLERSGQKLLDEWKVAKQVEGELIQNILKEYNRKDHYNFIALIKDTPVEIIKNLYKLHPSNYTCKEIIINSKLECLCYGKHHHTSSHVTVVKLSIMQELIKKGFLDKIDLSFKLVEDQSTFRKINKEEVLELPVPIEDNGE